MAAIEGPDKAAMFVFCALEKARKSDRQTADTQMSPATGEVFFRKRFDDGSRGRVEGSGFPCACNKLNTQLYTISTGRIMKQLFCVCVYVYMSHFLWALHPILFVHRVGSCKAIKVPAPLLLGPVTADVEWGVSCRLAIEEAA